ncbi:MAG TPA: flagellar FlbD family protein [Firmicutes bacterium]|jgi:flagellar protein FlbD|nr:flagellar FlbD family protein [Bacillota bacterium]HOQ23570.1 flagellar FlbD family protein [Bacillota bacterium]HPT67257.1 flagellar FlbD family protein [Bacillota bacterium]
MVRVTRFNGKEFFVNPHLIEFIEATPDTVITLVTGKKIVITESVETVLQRIVEYRKQLGEAGREPLPQVVMEDGEE